MIPHLCVTLDPSPHLQRLSPVRAALSSCSIAGERFRPSRSGMSSELPFLWFSKERLSTDIHSPRPVLVSPFGDSIGPTLLHA